MEDLYFVYWKNGTRKALVNGKNEEDAIKNARRFAGEYTKISKVEKLDVSTDN